MLVIYTLRMPQRPVLIFFSILIIVKLQKNVNFCKPSGVFHFFLQI